MVFFSAILVKLHKRYRYLFQIHVILSNTGLQACDIPNFKNETDIAANLSSSM